MTSVFRTIAGLCFFISSLCSSFPARSAEATIGLVELQTNDVGNFAIMKELAEEAKKQGAVMVIYPEASDLGWLNPDAFTKAEPIPGKYSSAFTNIASEVGIWVAAGLTEKGPKAGPGSLPDAFEAYDAGVLIDPQGQLVIHHRQFNVVRNAFDPTECQAILNQPQCSYTAGDIRDIRVVRTPFGRTALLVCADAYTYAPATALEWMKTLSPDLVIVPWGVTAAAQNECGMEDFNATTFAGKAAAYLKSAFVVGANAVGPRTYGRFRPSVYCGGSGYATPTGEAVDLPAPKSTVVMVRVPDKFQISVDEITDNSDAARLCPAACGTYASGWDKQSVPTGKLGQCGCVTDTGP